MVVLVSQFVGFVALVVAGLALDQPLSSYAVLAWGALAGVVGVIGIASLYRGLAIGPMSVVAPVSAVLAASIPIPVSILEEGAPSQVLVVGFAFALVGIWLVARGAGSKDSVGRRALVFSVAAGVAFGLFYIVLDHAAPGGTLWPLAAARVPSIVLLAPYVLARRVALPTGRQGWGFTIAAGLLDSTGNILFMLDTVLGRLDVAAVLLSLYPAATVALAFLALKERLSPSQLVGVAVIAIAIVLVSVG